VKNGDLDKWNMYQLYIVDDKCKQNVCLKPENHFAGLCAWGGNDKMDLQEGKCERMG
jgi:hypothetical protein